MAEAATTPADRTTRPRGRSTTRRTGPPARRDPRGPGRDGGAAGRANGPGATGAIATRQHQLAEPRHWFAQRLLLVLSGRKPVHWMLGHTVGAAYDQLVRLAPPIPLGPPGAERVAPVVARCDEYRPEPRVIEAFARIRYGDRLRALAFRLEQAQDNRWRCSAIELG
ncbi:Rv3235 family protein [Streptomyces pathocidini]|uniref:Rv3235 family protein n=1 Tax=Streptomyces pathocidini TaxID=1650571 RepID=UPI0033E427A0